MNQAKTKTKNSIWPDKDLALSSHDIFEIDKTEENHPLKVDVNKCTWLFIQCHISGGIQYHGWRLVHQNIRRAKKDIFSFSFCLKKM